MTKEEKVHDLINQKDQKANFELIIDHVAKEQLEYSKMISEEEYQEALSDFEEYKENFSFEKISPIISEILLSEYTDEEVDYLYNQSKDPILKQITAKAGQVNIEILTKLEEWASKESTEV
jgi:hypothetical protein